MTWICLSSKIQTEQKNRQNVLIKFILLRFCGIFNQNFKSIITTCKFKLNFLCLTAFQYICLKDSCITMDLVDL